VSVLNLNPIDKAWIDALRRFMGDGHGPVPFYSNPDGSVNAEKTVEAAFSLYGIKPKL
jgi:hypothetical protein